MSKFSVGIIALLAGMVAAAPSFAQGTASMGDKESPMQRQEKIKQEERKTIERDYEKTMARLKKQGATATSNDPWANVRPAAETKAETKTETKNELKKR